MRYTKEQCEAAWLRAEAEVLSAVRGGVLRAYSMDGVAIAEERFVTVADLRGVKFLREDLERIWPAGEPALIERPLRSGAGTA